MTKSPKQYSRIRLGPTPESECAAIDDRFTFVIYGIDSDNGDVRASVFAQKVAAVVRALRVADREVNGGKRHEVLVADLEKHSAQFSLRERVSSRKRVIGRGSDKLNAAFRSIYQFGPRASDTVSPRLLNAVAQITFGIQHTFSHAEVGIGGDNVVRIDEFFISQVVAARMAQHVEQQEAFDPHFAGISRETYDGTLKVIDTRGQLVRATLTLSAGGKSIECVLKRDMLNKALSVFEQRVSVEGSAIYDGTSYLPKRINILSIRLIKRGDILSWQGKFKILVDLDSDWA